MKDKEYALVLEGGGTKGAYQVGVWKALKELEIKIKAISGTSISTSPLILKSSIPLSTSANFIIFTLS